MPRKYPSEFREKVLDLVRAGRPVVEVAEQLGVTNQTIYNWKRQDEIDRGLREGLTTAEAAELRDARRRIRQLETELEVTRRVMELLKETSDPKGGSKSSTRS